jgi:exonuclease-1
VDISPDVAHCLIAELQKAGVEFIVAPYEADAQLAYLARTGYIDGVLTEDSDLLAFGCTRVYFKVSIGDF